MGKQKQNASSIVREIKRKTRGVFSAEDNIKIVRGEDSIGGLCRKPGIHENIYYNWSKEFLEAGKKRMSGDTAVSASTSEIKDLREENIQLTDLVAELSI